MLLLLLVVAVEVEIVVAALKSLLEKHCYYKIVKSKNSLFSSFVFSYATFVPSRSS